LLTGIAGRVGLPTGSHQLDDLVGPFAAGVEVLTERLELGFTPADPDGKLQPATGQRVETGGRIRQPQRVVLRCHQHAGAETDPLGRSPRPGERQERIEQVRRRVVLRRGLRHVVADPQVDEAELLGELCGLGDRLRPGGSSVLREVDPDLHASTLEARRKGYCVAAWAIWSQHEPQALSVSDRCAGQHCSGRHCFGRLQRR
jgi:hypothetical protein